MDRREFLVRAMRSHIEPSLFYIPQKKRGRPASDYSVYFYMRGRNLNTGEYSAYPSGDGVFISILDRNMKFCTPDGHVTDTEVYADAYTTWHLTPGIYYYKELTSPRGYELHRELYEFTVEDRPNETQYYNIPHEALCVKTFIEFTTDSYTPYEIDPVIKDFYERLEDGEKYNDEYMSCSGTKAYYADLDYVYKREPTPRYQVYIPKLTGVEYKNEKYSYTAEFELKSEITEKNDFVDYTIYVPIDTKYSDFVDNYWNGTTTGNNTQIPSLWNNGKTTGYASGYTKKIKLTSYYYEMEGIKDEGGNILQFEYRQRYYPQRDNTWSYYEKITHTTKTRTLTGGWSSPIISASRSTNFKHYFTPEIYYTMNTFQQATYITEKIEDLADSDTYVYHTYTNNGIITHYEFEKIHNYSVQHNLTTTIKHAYTYPLSYCHDISSISQDQWEYWGTTLSYPAPKDVMPIINEETSTDTNSSPVYNDDIETSTGIDTIAFDIQYMIVNTLAKHRNIPRSFNYGYLMIKSKDGLSQVWSYGQKVYGDDFPIEDAQESYYLAQCYEDREIREGYEDRFEGR